MVYAYELGMPVSEAIPLVLVSVIATAPVALPAAFTLATAIGAQALAKSGAAASLKTNADFPTLTGFVPFDPATKMSEARVIDRDGKALAESILHECMHLQLTLIESQTRLLDAENELHLSPWRQTLRPTRGVLHALYVFRVIQDFLERYFLPPR